MKTTSNILKYTFILLAVNPPTTTTRVKISQNADILPKVVSTFTGKNELTGFDPYSNFQLKCLNSRRVKYPIHSLPDIGLRVKGAMSSRSWNQTASFRLTRRLTIIPRMIRFMSPLLLHNRASKFQALFILKLGHRFHALLRVCS